MSYFIYENESCSISKQTAIQLLNRALIHVHSKQKSSWMSSSLSCKFIASEIDEKKNTNDVFERFWLNSVDKKQNYREVKWKKISYTESCYWAIVKIKGYHQDEKILEVVGNYS